MNIAIVNNSVIPVDGYGGTERVIWYLGKELAEMGHKVTYIVRAGSYCPFADVQVINHELPLSEQIPESADVVHFNSQWDEQCPKPYIVTIHGNEYLEEASPNSVFVSKNHANRNGCDSFVYNGLDWNDYGSVNYNLRKEYYHFLGKAAWKVKNVQGAIDITKRVSKGRLYVLGGDRFNFKMGMRFTFTPKVKFFGMVDGEQKKSLLQSSKGLLFPVRWHEPFGLAIIESLYYGLPIFGTPYGSLPELVNSEVGFLSDDGLDIVRAMEGSFFSRKVCHEYAADSFSSRAMALAYLAKYETVISGATLCDGRPQSQHTDKRLLKFTI